MKINDSFIKRKFGKEIAKRGYDYYKERSISNLIKEGNKFSATVLGSDDYTTEIEIGENSIRVGCDCPYEGEFCKHGAAVLYAAINEKIKEPRFKEVLEGKTKEELIEYLLFILKEEPKFASRINLRKSNLQKEIEKLTFGYHDYHETRAAVKELKGILRGVEFASKNDVSSSDMIKKMELCIKILLKGIESFDDSDGLYGEFIGSWVKLYSELFKKSDLSSNKEKREEFVETILNYGIKNDYGLEDYFYDAILEFIDESDLDFAEAKIRGRIDSTKDKYDKDTLIILLLEIYSKFNLNDEFIHLAKAYGQAEELIEKLIELNNLDEALRLCDNQIKNLNGDEEFKKNDLLKLKSKILEKVGDDIPAIENLFYYVTENPTEYESIKKLKQLCLAKNIWVEWKEKLIDYLDRDGDKYPLVKFCLFEKEYLKAYETAMFMCQEHPRAVEKTAIVIEKDYPNESADLYQRLAKQVISYAAGRDSYRSAVECLKKALILSDNKNKVIKLISSIRKANPKKYALLEELGRIK